MPSRYPLLLGCFLLLHLHAAAQIIDTTGMGELNVSEAPAERIYEMYELEKAPVFPGGEMALLVYIAENIRAPARGSTTSIPGTIALSFLINKDGKVCNMKMMKSLQPEWEAAILDSLRSMPDWKPGMAKGEAVTVRYTLSIKIHWQ